MDIYALLRDTFPETVFERDFSFAKHTTIGCGGTAKVRALPSGAEDLAALISFLDGENIPYCFLGVGANCLPADGIFSGVAVQFCRINSIKIIENRVFAGAGATGGAILRAGYRNNIGGFEFLTGIPTSVGGAIVMNAGVQGRHLSDIVESVTAVENGKIRTFSQNECGFGEKLSIFQSGIAVVSATLRGEFSSREEIDAERERYRARRAHLPKGRSMGCVFVNPEGKSAGAIIDCCGLKGLSVGGARVSEEHANFIINDGATASEISELILTVKERVFEQTGIRLREEIRRIP